MRRCSSWKSGRGRSFINWSLKVSSGKRWPGLTRVCRAWCVKMFCVKWSALFMKKVRLLDTRILSGLKTSENISLVGNREMEVLSSRITAEAPPKALLHHQSGGRAAVLQLSPPPAFVHARYLLSKLHDFSISELSNKQKHAALWQLCHSSGKDRLKDTLGASRGTHL